MATIQAGDIDDLVKVTLPAQNRGRLAMMATEFQHHEVMNRLFRKDKVRYRSGTDIKYTVMTDTSGAAKQVGLYGVDNPNVPAVTQKITVPWRHTTVDWSYDVVEMAMNTGVEMIINELKIRDAASATDLADHSEKQFFGVPSSTADVLSVFGLPYWMVANASEGFNGGNHSSFSDGPGGLDSSVFTRYKNYTALYTDVTREDLIRKMKLAYMKIRFKRPVNVKDFRTGTGQKLRIYMNDTTIVKYGELSENQNDKLGPDLASMEGDASFRGIVVNWIPILDGTSSPSDPVYMLNFDTLFPVVLSGNFMRRTGPIPASEQHNTRTIFEDMTWNVACDDRRKNAVLVTAT